jgi:DNA-binding SARP family transcriptional activator
LVVAVRWRSYGGLMRTIWWPARWRHNERTERFGLHVPLGPDADGSELGARRAVASLEAAAAAHECLTQQYDQAADAHRLIARNLRARIQQRRGLEEPDRLDTVLFTEPETVSGDSYIVARLLGPFEVSIGGRNVGPWRSHRAASVLKYLLLHYGDPVPREALMAAFWPFSSPGSARNNLNVAVYAVRRSLSAVDPGQRHVVYQGGAYLLNASLRFWVDVHEHGLASHVGHQCYESGDTAGALEAYHRARRLYRGPLMEGDTSGEWFFEHQARLCDEHHLVLERLGKALLREGDLNGTIDIGKELVAADPCRETGHQLLMRGYAALQQRHLVVRQYRQCVDLLRRELSVEPDGATRTLLESLVGTQPTI